MKQNEREPDKFTLWTRMHILYCSRVRLSIIFAFQLDQTQFFDRFVLIWDFH